MKDILKFFTTGIFLLFLFASPLSVGEVDAAIECPSTMSDLDCYDYLNSKLRDLEKSQGSLKSKLKDEEYQQLSLQEKISYINEQVAQTEKVIDTLEVEIATQDVEIKLLTKEIQTQEDTLSTLNQEILLLENTVNKRISESYKFSFVGPLELFMDTKNLESILRKTKYLFETRLRDKESLGEFNEKSKNLEEYELVLAEQKANLQKKRNEIESEKSVLVSEKNTLDSQKAEKARLLAESERREKDYKAQIAAVGSAIAQADEIISDLVIKLFNQGQLGNGSVVSAGQVIGFEGHTGCSYGSHLHFEIRNKYDVKQNPGDYLNLGTYITGKVYRAPMDGAVLTQGTRSGHMAWDMVSVTRGNQNLNQYTVASGICWQVDNLIAKYGNKAYLRGEGAPIYAVASGKVYYYISAPNGANGSQYPQKSALVVHNDGNKSFYTHLQ